MPSLKIRTSDDGVEPNSLNLAPHYGDISIDNDTGVVITAPTSATTVGGAPAVVATEYGLDAAVNGTFTIARPGNYRLRYFLSEITPVNNQVLTFEAFIDSTPAGGRSRFNQPATAVPISTMAGCSPPIACVVGSVLTLKVTASTGNVTIKRGQIIVEQVAD
jgi:hypothetical protein